MEMPMRWSPVLVLLVACKPPAAPVSDTPVVIPVLALNDFHGSLYEAPTKSDPTKALGGLPWLAAAIDSVRAEDPDALVLDGGDLFQGDWPVNASKGMGSVQAYDLMKVDAAAVGNHEFDYGPMEEGGSKRGYLEAAAKEADFAWLTANVTEHDGSRWEPEGIAPWTVIERKGKRIGVVGLTTMDTPTTTLAKNVDDLTFADPVQTIRDLLPELEAADLDATILVGHLTGKCEPKGPTAPDSECTPDGEIGRLLTELPPGTFDVMVLGHAHTLLSQRVGDTYVFEGWSKGQALNRVDLVIGPDGVDIDASHLHPVWGLIHDKADPGCDGGPFPMDPRDVGGVTLTPSAGAVTLIGELESKAGSLCTQVGCVTELLGRARESESDVGDYVADAELAAYPGADIAIANSGGLRADIPAGILRRQQLQAVMPFDNRLMLVEMTGDDVRELFRIGASGVHGVLQVAGATYAYDPALTGGTDRDGSGAVEDWERERLCGVTVGGAPLDPARTYKVVITDFLWTGGDHVGPALAHAKLIDGDGPLLREVLFDYRPLPEGQCVAPLVKAEAPRIRVGTCAP